MKRQEMTQKDQLRNRRRRKRNFLWEDEEYFRCKEILFEAKSDLHVSQSSQLGEKCLLVVAA